MKMPPMNHQHNPNEGQDRQRMIVAVVISLAILFGFHHFIEKPRLEKMRTEQASAVVEKKADVAPATAAKILPRVDAVAQAKRIPIVGDKITGSLSLTGAVIDDILLNGHFTSVEKTERVALLSPSGSDGAFFTGSGWISSETGLALPDDKTVWSRAAGSPAQIESGGKPVVLQWDNGQGVTFQKEISLDDNYLFTVTDRVINRSASSIKINNYSLVSRRGLPKEFTGMFILHEGPYGFMGGKEYTPDYKDLIKGEKVEVDSSTGWLGITDKYWMVMLLPEPSATFDARITGVPMQGAATQFQTDMVTPTADIAAGTSMDRTTHVYAGVKNLSIINAYSEKYGFANLALSMDFGMWWFITKPFYLLLHFLTTLSGNIAIAILLMTVIVRAFVFPLANKSFRSMAKMKVVAPMMKELQEKYGSDRQKLQAEIYELYRREEVNPFSGCWPILIQIPIFFALYKVILLSVELRHAPFWGWVHDLSAPDPTTVFNLFGVIPWDPPKFLMIGAWPVLFCLTMVIQKRISPPMPDEMQERIQGWFPYIVTIMLAQFAAGLVIYWTWSNVLGILQQYYILKKVGGEETSLIRGHSARRKKKEK